MYNKEIKMDKQQSTKEADIRRKIQQVNDQIVILKSELVSLNKQLGVHDRLGIMIGRMREKGTDFFAEDFAFGWDLLMQLRVEYPDEPLFYFEHTHDRVTRGFYRRLGRTLKSIKYSYYQPDFDNAEDRAAARAEAARAGRRYRAGHNITKSIYILNTDKQSELLTYADPKAMYAHLESTPMATLRYKYSRRTAEMIGVEGGAGPAPRPLYDSDAPVARPAPSFL